MELLNKSGSIPVRATDGNNSKMITAIKNTTANGGNLAVQGTAGANRSMKVIAAWGTTFK